MVEASLISKKWLVILYLNGTKHTISPHWQQQDAIAAARIVRSVFGQFSPRQLRNPITYSSAIQQLNYDDDDELQGVFVGGQFYNDPEVLAPINTQIRAAIAQRRQEK